MPFSILTAESIRTPLEPLLDQIIAQHISHRLTDDFLVITPDLPSVQDVRERFIRDPRLGGVLTGRSLMALPQWIYEIGHELEPSGLKAPPWVLEVLFARLAQDRMKRFLGRGSFSLTSLFHLIRSFREEFLSEEALRSFIAHFDPLLAEECVSLAREYQQHIERYPFLKDTAWFDSRVIQGIRQRQVVSLMPIKKIYWLGFLYPTPLLKQLIGAIDASDPHLEQILLTELPRNQDLQDFISGSWDECVSSFRVDHSTPSAFQFFEFSSPFEEAGFILSEIAARVEKGIPAQEMALFIPPDPFWEHYFSSELSKLGLFASPQTRRVLANFSRVAGTLHLPLPEACQISRDLAAQARQLFFKKLTASEKDLEEQALEIRALDQWIEILEQRIFFEHEEILKEAGPSILSLARLSFLKDETYSGGGASITLRSYREQGVRSFQESFIFGCNDHLFPQAQNYFFGRQLPESSRSLKAERAHFQHLLGSGRQTMISYSTHRPQGKQAQASCFLREFGFLPASAEKKYFYPIFISPEESPDFQQRQEMECRRIDPLTAGRYGGRIGDPVLLSRIRDQISSKGYTPQQLENYALCPFKYFASALLKLKGPEEKRIEGSPQDQGIWLHQFLQLFFSEHREKINHACKNPSARRELLSRIPSTLEDFSNLFLKQRPWIHEMLSEDFILRATQTTVRLLQNFWEVAQEQQRPFLPRFFEIRFEEKPLSFPFRIRGCIDRIDLTEDEAEFLVFDYKTGSSAEILSREINHFRSFQLPLYLLAAEKFLAQKLSFPPRSQGAMAIDLKKMEIKQGLVKQEGGQRLKLHKRLGALKSDADWKTYFERLEVVLSNLHERILSGDFRVLPNPCDPYCDYRTLCRYENRESPHT